MKKKPKLKWLGLKLQLHLAEKILKYSLDIIFLNLNIIANYFLTNYKFRRIIKLNKTRQIINTFKPFEEKYFNKKSIANNEDKNVVVIPIIIREKLNEENS